jgi:hypothetical protein
MSRSLLVTALTQEAEGTPETVGIPTTHEFSGKVTNKLVSKNCLKMLTICIHASLKFKMLETFFS